jgi:1,4-dihydroxy-2-naphthoate octaprenyltransferase
VLIGFFTPVMLAVFMTVPTFLKVLPMFRQPKPSEKPADFPDVWPNYFVAAAFVHNRAFGVWFLLGLIVDAALKVWVL